VTPVETRALMEAIAAWVQAHSDLKSLGLVGSWARDDWRPDSDLDLLIIADDPTIYRFSYDWPYRLPLPEMFRVLSHTDVAYGAVWSRHLFLQPKAELELTFCTVGWASTGPIDDGTRDIVVNGLRVIVDKEGHLQRLTEAVQKSN
jgi:hypothetical protein